VCWCLRIASWETPYCTYHFWIPVCYVTPLHEPSAHQVTGTVVRTCIDPRNAVWLMMLLCTHDFLLLCHFICGYPYSSAEMLLVPLTGSGDMTINGYDTYIRMVSIYAQLSEHLRIPPRVHCHQPKCVSINISVMTCMYYLVGSEKHDSASYLV